MANNVKPAGTEKKPGVWKSFAVLMTSVKVPWVWVGLATLVSLFGAQLSLIIPDATAQVAAGDVSMGAILFMVGCMFLSALETSVRQIFGRITSTRWTLDEHLLFQRRLCCDGVALMSAELRTEDLSSVLIFSHHLRKILVVLYISPSLSKYGK